LAFIVKNTWFSVGRILLTLVVVAVAAFVLWRLIGYYMFSPWTRDGHVRADVIQVAPDVTGLISRVGVADNQEVERGQVLFVVDQARYALALRMAQATALQRRATLDQARREEARNRALGDLVARELAEESRSRVQQAEALLADAQVAVDAAQLNLRRTTIVSPVDGYLNDRAPRAGEYVTAGRAVL
jgi:multidrug resistance efflux pump